MKHIRDSLLVQFLFHPSSVGAVMPSGQALARSMVDSADLSKCRSIVEYGPGTGVFTAEILARRTPGTPLLVIERNENFCRQLRERFAGVEDFYLVEGSAEKVAEYLAERNLPLPDAILSGLPFTSLPKEISEKILSATAQILSASRTEEQEEGSKSKASRVFITFQYSMLKLELLKEHFDLTGHTRVWRNIPPAHVLVMKPKNDLEKVAE